MQPRFEACLEEREALPFRKAHGLGVSRALAQSGVLARDRGFPALAAQVLVYPVCDHAFGTPSYRAYASPLKAPELAGLPPAFVATGECDVLRDEGEAYAERLAEAGVPTVKKRYPGMVHGFLGAQANLDIAEVISQA